MVSRPRDNNAFRVGVPLRYSKGQIIGLAACARHDQVGQLIWERD